MTRIEERLRFERDGTVTALSGKMEYGQGLRAAYPRIVAEELGIDPQRVSLVLGDTDQTPWESVASIGCTRNGIRFLAAPAPVNR